MADPPWLECPREGLEDDEGARVDPALPPVIDAHVHLFPDGVFDAIWRWFDQHGWPVRYRIHTPEVVQFLLGRGVRHIVALHYAHKPGMARVLNAYVANICATEPRITGLATVLPGEPNARAVLKEAFARGLRGVKLHCHVQCFAPDAPEVREVYETCAEHDLPVVIHAGREPSSAGYKCDPHVLCSAERIERVLVDHPALRLCVPHFGADEVGAYMKLIARFDRLWLDTTMVFADYFPARPGKELLTARPERVMYGTDFPNIPYAWDRELKKLALLGLNDATLEAILGGTAQGFYGIRILSNGSRS